MIFSISFFFKTCISFFRRITDTNGEINGKTDGVKNHSGGVKMQKKKEEHFNHDGRRAIHHKAIDIDPHCKKKVC